MFPVFLILVVFCAEQAKSVQFPSRTLGFYVLIADDTCPGYTSHDNYQPQLYDYQNGAFNVLWLTFINPKTMPLVPPAMINFAKCKGQPGCPGVNVPVILSIGGDAYSKKASSWPWLSSEANALSMAAEVATWDTKYGVDGIDLDLEDPIGNNVNIANNMVIFAKQVNKLNPNFIITQPVYGKPGVKSENDTVLAGFDNGKSNGLIVSVGIMVYNGVYSLTFVPNYTGAPFYVPSNYILTGFGGAYPSSDITSMAHSVVQQNLGGMMVWFASVFDKTKNCDGLTYGSNDATTWNQTTGSTWAQALKIMTQ